METQLHGWIESLLFATEHPLSLEDFHAILNTKEHPVTIEMIERTIEELTRQYNAPHRGISIQKVAGGWQFRSNPEYAAILQRFFEHRPPRLSKAALECIAIIAYRQPITRAEVSAIRGVDSSGIIRSLSERKLIMVAGRQDSPGRPFLYKTSPAFLEYFGLDTLQELPNISIPPNQRSVPQDNSTQKESS